MTDDEKIKMAVELCRKNAEDATTPLKECFELYAEILPVLVKWDYMVSERQISPDHYMTALSNAAATMLAYGARNLAGDDPGKVDQIGPSISAMFARQFYHACKSGETVAIIMAGGSWH